MKQFLKNAPEKLMDCGVAIIDFFFEGDPCDVDVRSLLCRCFFGIFLFMPLLLLTMWLNLFWLYVLIALIFIVVAACFSFSGCAGYILGIAFSYIIGGMLCGVIGIAEPPYFHYIHQLISNLFPMPQK